MNAVPASAGRGQSAAMPTVLIIDDHPGVGEALTLLLSLRGIAAHVALTPADGLALLAREPVDLVIQDMNFSADTTSGEEGVALFRAIREQAPDLPVILLTAWTRLETAVELVRAGAADYLAKPWDDAKLLATVQNLLLTGIGIGIGMVGAYAINELLMTHYELARLPLLYLPIGALLLVALGQLAVWVPARRAAALPPVVVLRGA